MADSNDHDILIKIQTMVESLIINQADYVKRHEALVARVAVLENQDSRDSEKFRGLTEEIRRSLNNSSKIDVLTTDVKNLGDSIRELKAKSNLWDIGNALAATIAGAIAWFR